MVMKKRMASPTQDGEASVPLHELYVSTVPQHIASDSDESSGDSGPHRSTSGSWDSLPLWSAGAHAQSDDSLSTGSGDGIIHSSNRRQISTPIFLLGLLMVGLAAILTSRNSVNTAAEQVSDLEIRKLKMDGKLIKARQDIQTLRREISAMDAMIQQQQDVESLSTNSNAIHDKMVQEIQDLQDHMHQLEGHAGTLKTNVQAMSRQQILQKYGPGKHYVEVELIFPDRKVGPTTFTLEMASIDEMPHSVHTFMEMVSTGLLDGCSFILNALHVLKAAPLPYDGTSAAAKAKAFTAHGLESVAFREYSEKYPHKQYTIGFAADGSPSFYINTEDNSDIHVGDPCFGKVVKGFDAIRRLEKAPTRNAIWFEKRIGIKSARIVTDSA